MPDRRAGGDGSWYHMATFATAIVVVLRCAAYLDRILGVPFGTLGAALTVLAVSFVHDVYIKKGWKR